MGPFKFSWFKMWYILRKPKFYTKCNSYILLTLTRLEMIQNKRKAVQKYLKNDIVELLRLGLVHNAYVKAERCILEQNLSRCYDLVGNFCACISSQVSTLLKENECPDECKEAISSLIYAAARLADLPELRDLRTLFNQKYGNSFEPFVSKELVEMFRLDPPTKERKVKLLQEISQEFSIEWDSKALEEKFYLSHPTPQSVTSSIAGDDEWNARMAHGRNGMESCSEDDTSMDLSSQESTQETSSISAGSVSEDEIESKTPFQYEAYRRGSSWQNPPSSGLDEMEPIYDHCEPVVQEKPKPRLVRRRPQKPSPEGETGKIKATTTESQISPRDDDDDGKRGISPLSTRRRRAISLQPEMPSAVGWVHPRMPDYDELAARIAALRKSIEQDSFTD